MNGKLGTGFKAGPAVGLNSMLAELKIVGVAASTGFVLTTGTDTTVTDYSSKLMILATLSLFSFSSKVKPFFLNPASRKKSIEICWIPFLSIF